MKRKVVTVAGLAMWLLCICEAGAAEKRVAKVLAVPAVKPAFTAAPDPTTSRGTVGEDERAELNQMFKSLVTPRFTVRHDDQLDPEMRAAAETMRDEHLPRVRALMESWLLEEKRQPNPQWALRRMAARLVNEFAIWGRDSTGRAQDAALAEALGMPGMCRPVGPKASELVLRLGRLRNLEPQTRRAAVQAEAELLTRWGQPRTVSDAEAMGAEDALLQLRATGQAPRTPLPPVLAFRYLGDGSDSRLDPDLAEPSLRCAMHQWAGAGPEQFRAAMSMQAADVLWANRRKAAAPTSDEDPYPALANYFGGRGMVTVQADVNSEGRVVRAKVVKREVEVPGIRGVRPFAHESVLELASLAKARELDWSAAAPAQGIKAVEREIGWSLSWR